MLFLSAWHAATNGLVCLIDYTFLRSKLKELFMYYPSTTKRVDFVTQTAVRFVQFLKKNAVLKSMNDITLAGYCLGEF